jgi:hypothetical protein
MTMSGADGRAVALAPVLSLLPMPVVVAADGGAGPGAAPGHVRPA